MSNGVQEGSRPTGRGEETLRRMQRVDLRAVFLPVAAALVGVLALNLLFYAFLTRPRLELAAGSQQAFRKTELRRDREREATREVRDTLSKVRCVSSDLETFRDEVLSSKVERMTRVQKTLRELARTFNMNPENINYQVQEIEDGSLLGFAIRFPLTGSYEDLRQFLQHVEDSEHFLLINQVALTGSRQGSASLDLSIEISTYFAQTDEEAAGRDPSSRRARAGRRL